MANIKEESIKKCRSCYEEWQCERLLKWKDSIDCKTYLGEAI